MRYIICSAMQGHSCTYAEFCSILVTMHAKLRVHGWWHDCRILAMREKDRRARLIATFITHLESTTTYLTRDLTDTKEERMLDMATLFSQFGLYLDRYMLKNLW